MAITIYLVFFILCVGIVAVGTATLGARKKALLFGCLSLGMAYLVEINGVRNSDWNYANVNSVFRVTDIPIEILFGYFTAAFCMVVLATYLPRISSEQRRRLVFESLFLALGIVLLAVAYAYHTMSILVGWSLLGVYGLSVARDRTVPLAVGMGAFLADWAVEGMLTARMEYYTDGWDPTIGLVFMLVGMFISGLITHESLAGAVSPVQALSGERRSSRTNPVTLGGEVLLVSSHSMDRKD